MSENPVLDFAEMVKYTTAPPTVPFHLSGFQSEEAAKEMANWTFGFIKAIGVKLNLEALDGVTIAFDYKKALAELDRGYETSFVLTPSSEFAYGVAMAPAVKRDSIVKTHIVFDAGVFTRFMNAEDEYWPWLYYQLERFPLDVNLFVHRGFPNSGKSDSVFATIRCEDDHGKGVFDRLERSCGGFGRGRRELPGSRAPA